MDLERGAKKLREAGFFLDKMVAQESLAFGDKEPFDFYLSAFLGAGMALRETFHYEQDRQRDSAIKTWRTQWENSLSPTERCLFDFMRKDRVADFHRSGSSRGVKNEEIKVVGDSYSDKSGSTLSISAATGTPPATISKPTYNFTIAGTERKATDACAEYLALLEQMLAKFRADHP
jgi:hypothetical protein